jgi:hypothetical protein
MDQVVVHLAKGRGYIWNAAGEMLFLRCCRSSWNPSLIVVWASFKEAYACHRCRDDMSEDLHMLLVAFPVLSANVRRGQLSA